MPTTAAMHTRSNKQGFHIHKVTDAVMEVLKARPVLLHIHKVTDADQNGTHTRSNKQGFLQSRIPQKSRRKRDIWVN